MAKGDAEMAALVAAVDGDVEFEMSECEHWRDYDWQGMAEVLKGRGTVRRSLAVDAATLFDVFDPIQHMAFPPGYLKSIRAEMIEVLRSQCTDGMDRTCVYLTFFGNGDRASHMKIGIAKGVKSRLSSIRTGNPIPHLWTYATAFHSRQMALRVEGALLRHMASDRAQGEWVNVHGLSEGAARAVVDSLAEVAAAVSRDAVAFHRTEV
jgi:hypothetical protein